MTIISKDISKAIELLSSDDLVAIPTETVYGLAGNIFSEIAIRKIFEMKQRSLFNPLIVHLSSTEKLKEVISEFPEAAKKLADAFWPGSLTLVLKKNPNIPDIVTAGKNTVAVRIPNHPVTLELLSKLPFPLAAPSANPFGCISPTSALHVENYFKDTLSMVLKGGNCSNGIESTIIGFENEAPVLYRLGAISIEDIENVVGYIEVKNKKESAPDAPGMLSRHYAPETTTFLVPDVEQFLVGKNNEKVGVLLFNQKINLPNIEHTEYLSEKGDLKEAASNLYNALHKLDKSNVDMIVVEKLPDYGLGKSINDRLERATKKA